MIEFNSNHNSLSAARLFDQEDSLREFRDEFHFPEVPAGEDSLYFCGHSLGLMPKKTEEYLQAELDDWKTHGVEGHFRPNIHGFLIMKILLQVLPSLLVPRKVKS